MRSQRPAALPMGVEEVQESRDIKGVKVAMGLGEANANVTDNKGGQTPLILAANKGNLDIVKALLKYVVKQRKF